ncbi:hypothetical protein D3C83_51060 [compost metagenome]
MPAHEPGHAVLAHPVPALTQRLVYPRAAIDSAALTMHRTDLGRQRLVLALTLATLARAPGVEPGSRYPIHAAHQRESVLVPVYFDELEDFRFRPEANRMAFFRSSCSSLSTL